MHNAAGHGVKLFENLNPVLTKKEKEKYIKLVLVTYLR